MSADILEKLAADLQDYADGLGSAPIIVHDRAELYGLLVRTAAEIVRLRGEVGRRVAWAVVVNDCTCAVFLSKEEAESEAGVYGDGPKVEVRPLILGATAPAEAKDPAPAMPNGVEAARVLADFAETAPGRLPGRVLDAIATIRAADNRDAAGVVPAWIATWMADREILPDDDGDGISEGALVEALNNHERELLNAIPKAPAAVPAGEAECSCDELTQEADGSISGLCSVCLAYLRPKPVQAAPQEGEVTLPGQRLTAVLLERYAGTTTAHAHGDTQDAAELARQYRALQHRGDSRGGESSGG